jgi:hypothetical protein
LSRVWHCLRGLAWAFDMINDIATTWPTGPERDPRVTPVTGRD